MTLFVQKSSAFELINDVPVKELTVCGHKTETHTYNIEARELGNINFTIRVTFPLFCLENIVFAHLRRSAEFLYQI